MDYISKCFTRRIFGQFVTIVARKILVVAHFRPLWFEKSLLWPTSVHCGPITVLTPFNYSMFTV